ncbi:hypothetical protein IJT93_13350 [bacterium]|nr:hypothetical protein [bacterium]
MFGKELFKSEKVTDFEYIKLRESGMRFQNEYELNCKGPKTEILCYTIFYCSGEDGRRLEGSASCDTETVINMLNEYGFIKWDGFNGPHPKWVKDGVMFRMEASVNGGRVIKASGSQNFPKHYHEFMQWINDKVRS